MRGWLGRWGIEAAFRDTKDLRFGMGMASIRVSTPERRDRLWLLNAFAVDMPIQKVDTKTILDTVGLRKLWIEQNPSAVTLHSYLNRMFSLAIAARYYHGKNPAAWEDHLEHVLPPTKDGRAQHFAPRICAVRGHRPLDGQAADLGGRQQSPKGSHRVSPDAGVHYLDRRAGV
jgi:hypothetical protein